MAACSRLLVWINSPETRLERVSLQLAWESISICLCFPFYDFSFLYLDEVYDLSYFTFLYPHHPLCPLFLCIFSPCVLIGGLCYLLWRLCSASPALKSPPLPALYAAALLMVFLMAADGLREPLAPGLGVQRSFNKSQSVLCHYINIFRQLLWRSGGAASHQRLWYATGMGETSGATEKEQLKEKKIDTEGQKL